MTATLLSAFNVFLQTQGLDVCSRVVELHKECWPLVTRLWQIPRDARMRSTLITYLRLQLSLQVWRAVLALAAWLQGWPECEASACAGSARGRA